MANVSALPFVLGMAVGLLLFAAWLPMAVRESRRPYRWRETRPQPAAQHEAPALRLVDLRPKLGPHVVEPQLDPRRRYAAATRVAIVIAAFTFWSLWSLRCRIDPR
jgi:hypothetical protein